MHYVKQFKINDVDTRQVACIELNGKPNTATEGAVGLLGIDMSSPLHEVYKCVAVNGNIYIWELFSSGLSIVSATMSGGGEESVQFPYDTLKTPSTYLVKAGDLIIDGEGYLYQIDSIGATYCAASYCGTQVVAKGKSAYELAVAEGFKGTQAEWIASLKGEPGDTFETMAWGWYDGTGTYGSGSPNSLTFDFVPRLVILKEVKSNVVQYVLHSYNDLMIWVEGLDVEAILSSSTPYQIHFTRSGKTLSWYCDGSALYQFNDGYPDGTRSRRYSYVAFG